MPDQKSSKRHLLSLLGGLAMMLYGCQTPTPLPESTEFPEAVVVQHTPALRILTPIVEACAAEDLDLALFVEETPKTGFNLDSQEENLTRLGMALGEPPANHFAAALGEVQIAIIVHPSNALRELNASEIMDLFSGQVQNWREIGGNDQEVTPWVLTPADESRQLIDAAILGEEKIFGLARMAADPKWMLEGVSTDPGAIGYLPSLWLDDSVKAINTEPALAEDLRLPLLTLAQSEPEGAARRLLVCLQSGIGQQRLRELSDKP